jgi:hypothetical protein
MAIIPSTAKVLNQYENVNTTYGGSKAMKAQSKWYTMQDVEDTINANLPYKVFTALVKQEGDTPSPQVVYIGTDYGNTLTIGVTYTIDENANGTVFTNVGAPNNNVGTSFIATGTTPANQNAFGTTVLLYDPIVPTATILENTIGNIWFTYTTTGQYGILSNNLFTENKTFINGALFAGTYNIFNTFVETGGNVATGRGYFFNKDNGQDDLIVLNTYKNSGGTGDGVIENPICIEIRVYN